MGCGHLRSQLKGIDLADWSGKRHWGIDVRQTNFWRKHQPLRQMNGASHICFFDSNQ